MRSTTIAALFATCLTATAVAQLPGPGITWSGTLGGSAGSYMPSCNNLPVPSIRGEIVDLRVWGDQNAGFILLASASTTPCVPIPGVGNGLLLAQPVFVVALGMLTQVTPCLSCPPGFEAHRFTVPTFLPPGTSITFQAGSFGDRRPALTVAITATVQ